MGSYKVNREYHASLNHGDTKSCKALRMCLHYLDKV